MSALALCQYQSSSSMLVFLFFSGFRVLLLAGGFRCAEIVASIDKRFETENTKSCQQAITADGLLSQPHQSMTWLVYVENNA